MLVQNPPAKTEPIISWEALPDDFILPDDPVENLQQPLLAAALNDALAQAGLIKPKMLIASNFGLVATVDQKIVVKAPDWLYVPQAEPLASSAKIRRSYTQYLQGDQVAIVMEFLSHVQGGELSIRANFPYGKLYFYEQILQVPIYVVFEPFRPKLEVRKLQAGRYVLDSPDQNNRFWIPQFELFLGIWSGERNDLFGNWLRWWDSSGKMLPWSLEQVAVEREQAERAQQQAERAQQQAERAQQQANQAQQQAERAQQQANQAQQELEQVRQQANQVIEEATLIAEQAQKQAELFAKKLQELGIDPTDLS